MLKGRRQLLGNFTMLPGARPQLPGARPQLPGARPTLLPGARPQIPQKVAIAVEKEVEAESPPPTKQGVRFDLPEDGSTPSPPPALTIGSAVGDSGVDDPNSPWQLPKCPHPLPKVDEVQCHITEKLGRNDQVKQLTTGPRCDLSA